jgi:hypothetical protein
MSPERILDDLPPRLDVAAGGPRDAPARQQTLRAAIEWSYRLLAEQEQVALARVAVFVGGFAPDAARPICDAEPSELTALAAASLLVELETPGGDPRLVLLESIREYALERLDELGEAIAIRRRHAQYFLELAERAEPELERAAEEWLERLEGDYDNLRAALDWASHGAPGDELRMAVALRRFWFVRGHAREGQRRLEEALAHGGDQPSRLRATAAGAAGQLALVRSDYEAAKAWTHASLDLAASTDDRRLIAISFTRLADIAKAEGDLEAASRYYGSALEVGRELPDPRPLAVALTNAGSFTLMRGDIREAERLTRESLSLWKDLGHLEGIEIALHYLAAAAIERDALAEALAYLEEAFDVARRLGFAAALAQGLGLCAAVAARTGDSDRAARLVAAMDAFLEEIDAGPSPHARLQRENAIDAIEAELTREQLAAARDAGRAMSSDEAVAYGLEAVREAAAATAPASPGG